jgi:hypothetical protein
MSLSTRFYGAQLLVIPDSCLSLSTLGTELLVLVATVTKLTSSIDDIVWLLPFVSTADRSRNMRNGLLYVVMMEVVVGLASAIAFGGGAALQSVLDEGAYWNTERVLGVASGICLLLYSAFLFQEYLQGDDEATEEGADEEEGADGQTKESPAALASLEGALGGAESNESDAGQGQQEEAVGIGADEGLDNVGKKKPEGNLVVICFLGSLDDMSVQVQRTSIQRIYPTGIYHSRLYSMQHAMPACAAYLCQRVQHIYASVCSNVYAAPAPPSHRLHRLHRLPRPPSS